MRTRLDRRRREFVGRRGRCAQLLQHQQHTTRGLDGLERVGSYDHLVICCEVRATH